MDVSFTNVLEGARQYFQGLPVPSTGTIPSEDHNHPTSSTNSTSSSSTSHDHGVASSTVAPPPAPPPSTTTSSMGNQESTRYDVSHSSSSVTENGSSSSGTFWSPPVEPYPPQPTRVEVPDTRPGDDGSEPSSSSPGTVTLTEMQPSSHRTSVTSNFPQQKQSSSVSSASSDQHSSPHQTAAVASSSPRLHQMQPPPQRGHSPEPVYQQLNSVSKASFSTAEILATSHPTYQTANERQPQSGTTIVAQRTQYYPRYHHPDITKSAPAPFSQNSVYHSANVTVTSAGSVQQPATRPTPAEQSSVLVHGQDQQRVPSSYGPTVQSSSSGATAYVSSQNYRVSGQHQQSRPVVNPTDERIRPAQHGIDGANAHSSTSVASSSLSSSSNSSSNPCTSINPPCSPRHGSNHIPSSPQNLPPHIPSHHPSTASSVHGQHSQQQQQQQQQHQGQQQQHHTRINPSPHSGNPNAYAARTILQQGGPPQSSSLSSSSGHPQQIIPPMGLGGYHPIASPHEPPHHATPSPHRQSPHVSTLHNPHASSPHPTPSPHSGFQPHSPTYPPPPPPPPSRSTPHSYSVPATSQHYQTAGYSANPYAPPHQSSYHSFQKSPQPPLSQSHGNYYAQQNRSHSQSYVQSASMGAPPQPVCPGTAGTNGGTGYQQNKPVMYNGADSKRSPAEVGGSYASCRSSSTSMQRSNSTHNLPPIAALSSYHSNKRETGSKVQSIQRRVHSIGATNKVPVVTPSTSAMVLPQRIPDYPPASAPMNHTIPINGRTASSVNSSYAGRYSSQQNYSAYATTIAPSHHTSNSTSSTTVTSLSATVRSSVPPPPSHAYQSSEASGHLASYHHTIRTAESYPYKEQPYQNSSVPTAPAVLGTSLSAPPPQTNGIRKRESPLDLSVKTVKTSADSTAQDDLEASTTDKHASNLNLSSSSSTSLRSTGGSRSMAPPDVQALAPPPSVVSYSNYDGRVSARSIRSSSIPSACPRTSTPQTVRAPKVDFLPDFNSTPLRHHASPHDNSLRRSTGQQLYGPPPPQAPLPSQYANNTTPLPHMSTFQKSSLPPTPIYDGSPAPPPPSSSSTSSSSYLSGNDSSRSVARYPMVDHPVRIGPTTLPMQEYSTDPSKYYIDARHKFGHRPPSQKDHRTTIKRSSEAVYPGPPPTKQPRLDTWRIAIDKQIEQKLSTVRPFHEQQKRQEMSLPVAMPNGTMLAPSTYEQRSDSGYSSSESLRYQQAYCDKRNYPEPKAARTSPPYNHPPISKPTNVHALPQQVNSQTSYSNYRQNQRIVCPPVSAMAIPPVDQPSNTGADKRVLSLLRNSLENKQQREEQLNSQQPILVNHNQQSFQNKVVAPVEPKTNIGRHNLSPFTAASLLERNSNTPPHYKFHVPRAVDSITQEAPRSMYASRVNSSATLPGKEALLGPRGAENQIHRDKDDGLAAILAAKIRTKAELKQVGTGQFLAKPVIPSQDVSSTPKEFDSAASTSTPQSGSSAGSPPKLTREKAACLPPRRRLFSKTEEENMPVAATTVPVSTPTPAVASTVPPRASGFRSSSETSVFDFRESDSEGEMPVLERQTLEEMRRDRKQLSKVQPPIPLNDAMCMGMASSMDLVKIELKENDKISEVDPFWTVTCDKFMEQLRAGDAAKKRGRKKKLDGSSSKNDDTGNDSSKECDVDTSDVTTDIKIKVEDIKKEIQDVQESLPEEKAETVESSKDEEEKPPILETDIIKTEVKIESDIKKNEDERNSGDDSDEVPLIKRTTKKKTKKDDSDCEEEIICRKRRVRRGSRIKLASSSGSESSSEESDASTEYGHGSSVADRLRARKRSGNNTESEGMKLRSRDTTPHKAKPDKEMKSSTSKTVPSSRKSKPKPLFGDGSDFRPGWEEEVYVYKKSLRMPTRLITVSKPSRFHRLSTSLPDLDPGSPALSVSMDSSDVCLSRKRLVDSDVESDYSFSIAGLGSKIDDEEATSSTTISCPPKTTTKHTKSENNSIVDVLAQKVGTSKKDSKKKQQKDKQEKGTKILPKGNNEPELLPTPSLTPLLASEAPKTVKGKTTPIKNKLLKPIKVSDSFLLGYFRKETVNNFRDTFKNNHAIPNEFSTFVLKSRTRTETRVLKKQATIREVFGEDRPASAPPMQNHGDTSQDDDSQNETLENTLGKTRTLKLRTLKLRNAGILRSHKAIVNSKRHLLIAKRRKDLLKSLAEKKLKRVKTETEGEVTKETNDTQEVENNEIEDENNESEVPNKKKLKLRTGRRKFRSGFDYVRKKKRPLKKDDTAPKERKRILARPSPECVADIQSEIRTWVIKKGVGETILHRAARLGYTDVTAYCLEKLNNAPSPKDNAGYTPLHEACSRGHLEIAKLLLAYGANASESANGGIRPLHEAAESGATELVRLLLSYGADPLLATYSGQTPLMLAVDTDAYSILEQHLDDIQGRSSTPWSFGGPATIFDPEESGYNPLSDPPMDSPEAELDEIEMEVSDVNLPVLFSLLNDPDKWVLLQDLMAALRIKSRDALLRQVNPKAHAGPPAIAHRDVMRELKLPDFLEQSRCCHLLSGGEKINVRGSKVTLIKYNERVKSLLNVEKVLITLR
ncbi:hypothetical protein KPH14_003417 [Odynerus spinipes]|uniref:BCL-6 corepressor n=1 Tax=Odynerus spinipes TaxID=1348599 RepID=A0AAD9VKM9_9HYME|nr:hypothetical protein KPH14_003417 [Odynerus spinipes]